MNFRGNRIFHIKLGDYMNMKKKLSEEKIGFTQGVVYAVALCLRNFSENGAELIWKESNFDFSDLSVCEEYDAKIVRNYFRQYAKEPVIEVDVEKPVDKPACVGKSTCGGCDPRCEAY